MTPSQTAHPTEGERLPCPFCGGRKLRNVTDDGPAWTKCETCEATGPTTFKYQEDGPDWNTRPDVRPQGEEGLPIKMLLFCPNCGIQHVDAPEPPNMRPVHNGWTGEWIGQSNVAWTNPPHKSHLCHACGCIWRPADVPTEGVKAIGTKGGADTWSALSSQGKPSS